MGTRDFDIDLDDGIVSCPAGETAPIRTEPKGARRARFAKAARDRCVLRDHCVQHTRGYKAVLLAPDQELLLPARQALNDPVNAEHLRRTRPRVERLLGLLAQRYHVRMSGYIGTRKARLQAARGAALVNLNPMPATSPPSPGDGPDDPARPSPGHRGHPKARVGRRARSGGGRPS